MSVSLDNKSINEVLAVLFNGRNVRYEINDRHIVITRAGKVGPESVMQQTKRITGRVLDANNEPVIGANVVSGWNDNRYGYRCGRKLYIGCS